MTYTFLDNALVKQLLPVADCVSIAERALARLDGGVAVGPPRINLCVPVETNREYVLKSWQCADPGSGVAMVRLTSEVLELSPYGSRAVARAVPPSPGGGFVGLVLLLRVSTAEVIAVMHDSALADLAAAAAVGVAAKHLARTDSGIVGLLGAGRQAALQLGAIAAIRELREVRVFYPEEERRRRFSDEIASMAVNGRPVKSAAEAVACSDIAVAASSSPTPVFAAELVGAGMHVSLTRPSEAPRELYDKADVLVTSGVEEPVTYAAGSAGILWRQRRAAQPANRDRVLSLCAIVSGRIRGREFPGQITVYGALAGYSPGILYAALGAELAVRAAELGAASDLPSLTWPEQEHPS